ncbi:phospholipase ABHD3-like [Dermatophagoides pteronyssinus]|uniref:phospholipase ABHD3-like n=1 Tax=Dermatophagoides pteronyssinus TaxID=6956 RepID=UPI003F66D305
MYNDNSFWIESNTLTILSFIITIFIGHYLCFIVKKPKLICRNVKFRNFLEKNCPIITEKYWPTIWCYQSMLMSTLSTAFRRLRAPNIQYKRETIPTPDGAVLHLDHHNENDEQNDDQMIALFMPGLTGSSSAEYIRPLVEIASTIGYHSIVLNARGTGNNRLLTPRVYCCANDDDLRTCLAHLRKKYPTNKLIAIGLSFGGIVLSRYLSMTGNESKIDSAMLVSVCWNFIPNSYNLERWSNLPLNRYLTKCLIEIVEQNQTLFENKPNIDLKRIYSSQTLREFDDEFTSKQFGFKNAYEYYRESSNNERIHQIKRPTLCLNAFDDMFSLGSTLPCDKIENESTHVAMLITKRGGHIGFMDGLWPLSKTSRPYYLERLAKQYLLAFYHQMDKSFLLENF